MPQMQRARGVPSMPTGAPLLTQDISYTAAYDESAAPRGYSNSSLNSTAPSTSPTPDESVAAARARMPSVDSPFGMFQRGDSFQRIFSQKLHAVPQSPRSRRISAAAQATQPTAIASMVHDVTPAARRRAHSVTLGSQNKHHSSRYEPYHDPPKHPHRLKKRHAKRKMPRQQEGQGGADEDELTAFLGASMLKLVLSGGDLKGEEQAALAKAAGAAEAIAPAVNPSAAGSGEGAPAARQSQGQGRPATQGKVAALAAAGSGAAAASSSPGRPPRAPRLAAQSSRSSRNGVAAVAARELSRSPSPVPRMTPPPGSAAHLALAKQAPLPDDLLRWAGEGSDTEGSVLDQVQPAAESPPLVSTTPGPIVRNLSRASLYSAGQSRASSPAQLRASPPPADPRRGAAALATFAPMSPVRVVPADPVAQANQRSEGEQEEKAPQEARSRSEGVLPALALPAAVTAEKPPRRTFSPPAPPSLVTEISTLRQVDTYEEGDEEGSEEGDGRAAGLAALAPPAPVPPPRLRSSSTESPTGFLRDYNSGIKSPSHRPRHREPFKFRNEREVGAVRRQRRRQLQHENLKAKLRTATFRRERDMKLDDDDSPGPHASLFNMAVDEEEEDVEVAKAAGPAIRIWVQVGGYSTLPRLCVNYHLPFHVPQSHDAAGQTVALAQLSTAICNAYKLPPAPLNLSVKQPFFGDFIPLERLQQLYDGAMVIVNPRGFT